MLKFLQKNGEIVLFDQSCRSWTSHTELYPEICLSATSKNFAFLPDQTCLPNRVCVLSWGHSCTCLLNMPLFIGARHWCPERFNLISWTCRTGRICTGSQGSMVGSWGLFTRDWLSALWGIHGIVKSSQMVSSYVIRMYNMNIIKQ